MEAEWKVRAKYTHGGSVKGQVKANFTSTFQQRTWRPPPPIVKTIELIETVSSNDDCAKFKLNSQQIKDLTENVDNFDLNIDFDFRIILRPLTGEQLDQGQGS